MLYSDINTQLHYPFFILNLTWPHYVILKTFWNDCFMIFKTFFKGFKRANYQGSTAIYTGPLTTC